MIGPLILQVVLIFLNATFASAEIAVISMNETKLKKMASDGNKKAMRLAALTEQPARFLATIQVAITLAGLLGGAFAADSFAEPLMHLLQRAGIAIPENVLSTISVILITLILTYFNLVFGELVPKRIAMKKAEALSMGLSGLLHGVSKVFAPLVWLLTVSTNFILRLLGINPDENEEQVSEEEIRMLLGEGMQQGVIDTDENEFILNVFEFDDITAEEICTHRVDVVSLSTDDTMEEWEEIIYGTRHTYYPVCGENSDDILGVLDTKDYFRAKDKSLEYLMENAVDKAYFIPESMKANVLFKNMRNSGIYFAVVIDEYGGLSGIVWLHDLMEAQVGDLSDMETEKKPDDIEKVAENCWKIYGAADLEDVGEELDIELPIEVYDTFGGFLCGALGRIPEDGEIFTVPLEGFTVQVEQVENRRIGLTTVTRNEEKEDEAESEDA